MKEDSFALLQSSVVDPLREAVEAKKCWNCGCLHQALESIEATVPEEERSPDLSEALAAARARLMPLAYDCRGCEMCYGAEATNALAELGGQVVPTYAREGEPAGARDGWPPLAGDYELLRYQAPVAVCALTDRELPRRLADLKPIGLAIAGTLQTENLGIERLMRNLLANPHVRFLILCGADSRQAVGHLPGQSLLALAKHGTDGQGSIVGARGKRPEIKNLDEAAIRHFRAQVEVVDLIGERDPERVVAAIADYAGRDPGAAAPYDARALAPTEHGYRPHRLIEDPAGYFVIYVDHVRGLLVLEHYTVQGLLSRVVEGKCAAELYTPALERGLLTRLDHAAYLGQELARAEVGLGTGEDYVQDAAPMAQVSSEAAENCCALGSGHT